MEQIAADIENPPKVSVTLANAMQSYKQAIEDGEIVIRH
jgi:hypothetical protein